MKHYFATHRVKAFFLFAALLVSGTLTAQTYIDDGFLDNIEKNAKSVWDEPSPAFTSNNTPDAWKNESAIIMGYKRSILFDKKSSGGFFTARENSVYFFEKVRFKIKVQDKNSVEHFSEIYFRYGDKQDGFNAHIIKPGGEVQNVDLKEAVSVESTSDVPEFFKSFFDQSYSSQRRYYKVAVSNLEPGDILEYVANTKSNLNVTGAGFVEFTPQYEVCSKSYPVAYNEIDIETDSKSFFKSLSLNGAPEFNKESTDDKDFFKYVFIDKNREIQKDINFINELTVYPVVKFQVIYANKPNAKGVLIGDKGELKKGFSREELAKKAWEDYEAVGDYPYAPGNAYATVQFVINSSWADLKKLGAKEWPEKQYVERAYYYVRHLVVYRDTYLSDKMFAYIFGSLLYQRDIQSELVISISNDIGKLKDVLFDQEIRYAIKLNNQYYFNCTDHSNPGDMVQSLLGNDAYIIYKPAAKTGAQDIKPITLPEVTADDNTAVYNIEASLDAGMNNLSVKRKNTFTGISKAREMDEAMKFTTYMLDDYKYYGGGSPTDNMKSAQADEYQKSTTALKDEFKEAKPEFAKQELQREFGHNVKFSDYKIASDGRSVKNKTLDFTETFELPDITRKAGRKYLLSLTGLVGGQLQIKEEQRDRKLDISVGYPHTLTWNISFKIPDGYTVAGLTELNTNVENEAGKYSCEAKEENGSVVIKIIKCYKQRNVPKENWKNMLAFIDEAYNSSFKYILLKPKS
ncbi:MAG TPA: DUF3857 domain-containing protein [Chitinophagaceae bacterium]